HTAGIVDIDQDDQPAEARLRVLDAGIEFAREISGDGAVSLAGQQQRLRLDPRQRRLHVAAEWHRGVKVARGEVADYQRVRVPGLRPARAERHQRGLVRLWLLSAWSGIRRCRATGSRSCPTV